MIELFTIFGIDLTVTLLNVPFNFEYEVSVGDKKDKKKHDHKCKPPKKHNDVMTAEA